MPRWQSLYRQDRDPDHIWQLFMEGGTIAASDPAYLLSCVTELGLGAMRVAYVAA